MAVLFLGSGCVTQALWELEPASSLVVVSEHRVDAAIDVMASSVIGLAMLIPPGRIGEQDGEAAHVRRQLDVSQLLEPRRAADLYSRLCVGHSYRRFSYLYVG